MKMIIAGSKAFFAGVWGSPIPVRLWVFVLIIVNGVAPLLHLQEPAAQVMLIGFYTGSLVGFAICATVGFSRLLGLMHGPWIPAVYLIARRLVVGGATGSLAVWLVASLAVSAVSLMLDARDVGMYWNERQS